MVLDLIDPMRRSKTSPKWVSTYKGPTHLDISYCMSNFINTKHTNFECYFYLAKNMHKIY